MPVEWSPVAATSLRALLDFIADRNLAASQALLFAIETATEALPLHPYPHRPGRVAGTREIVVHPNYIFVYRVAARIEIVNVLHSRQQYP